MGKKNQFLATLAANIGAFALGNVLAWTSPSLQSMKEDRSSSLGRLSEEQESWVGAIVSLGCLMSGPITGFLIQKIGRKTTMIVMSPPFVVGWALIAFAQDVAMLLAGRYITGFCAGSFCLSVPLYVGEMAEIEIRGMLGNAFVLLITIGILFSYVVGAFINWQLLSLICMVVPALQIVAMLFMPESPRYLIERGKDEEASKALQWFRGVSSEKDVDVELEVMQKNVAFDKQQKASIADYKKKYNVIPFIFSLVLMSIQQFSGINAVVFYSKDIFSDAGADINADLSSIIVGIFQTLFCFISTVIVEKTGRRVLLLTSSTIMCIGHAAMGAYFQLKDEGKGDSIGWLPLISLVAFIASYSVGYGPLAWMMMSELLPPKIQDTTGAIASAFNWTCSFLVTKFFTQLQNALTVQGCYWLFGGYCAFATVFVFFLLPETKGKTLQEIQEHFGAPRRSSKF